MKNEPVILPDDDSAAEFRTDIEGWVSRRGNFFGPNGEQAARYDGITHSQCRACGAACAKDYTLWCPQCKDAREAQHYASMPQRTWDGEAMLYSDALDRYYSDLDHAEGDLEEGQSLADLRLIICEPVYASINEDYFYDCLPEDGDAPQELLDAIKEFNERMSRHVLSWTPGDQALCVESES